jgi:hypothetical protein
MSDKTMPITGGCMCGSTRYETTGESYKVLNCHCQSCRKHTGAPVVTLAVFKVDQVQFSGGERKIYQSSTGVGRGFCAECGTPLTWETSLGDLGPVCALHVSTCDNPDALPPIGHTCYSERISWFDVADNLPRYEGMSTNSAILHHGPALENQPD